MHAAVLFANNAVFVLCAFGRLLYVLMAGITQLRRTGLEHHGIVCTVPVMAADTVIFGRLVDELKFLQLVLCHYVAGKAQFRWLHGQQALMVGTVGFMTDCALSDRCRPVKEAKSFSGLVAVLTKVSYTFFTDKEFGLAAVRLMALNAVARFQRLVDILLGGLVQMAVLAQVPSLADKLPGMVFRPRPTGACTCASFP
jgi:hypothetical protein